MPPGSSNPDPISDLNMPFSTPVFRPELENIHPFSERKLTQGVELIKLE